MPVVRGAKLPLAFVSLALAWGLAACSHTRDVGASGTLRVALSEYHINPQSVHASSGVISIFVHNYGRLTHNLVVSERGQTIGSTKPVAPGQSAELDLNLAPGKYLMRSSILSDEALGQYGTLTIG